MTPLLLSRSRIEIGMADYVLKIIDDSFEHHASLHYEDACRDICHDLMKSGIMEFTAIGKWWSKNEEIDIIGLDEESDTVWFGECKWSTKQVGDDIYKDIVRKSKLVEWGSKKRKNRYILFSRSGFTKRMKELAKGEDVILVTGNSAEQY